VNDNGGSTTSNGRFVRRFHASSVTSVSSVVKAVSLSLFLAVAAHADDKAFALTGCRVVTGTGADVASGIVVVRDGKIESVAPWTSGEAPAGVEMIDATGKVLAPAFVHPATRLSMRDEIGGGEDTVEPTRTAANEMNPWMPSNAWTAANGFATLGLLPGRGIVGGRGVAVRTASTSIESMLRKDDAFLRCDVAGDSKFAAAFSGALSAARAELDAQAAYDKSMTEFATAKAKAEADKQPAPKEPDKPKPDAKTETYRKVLRGEIALLVTIDGAADARLLVAALADEHVRGRSLRLDVLCAGDAYRAAGELADLGATCFVRAGLVAWPNSTERVCPAVLFRNAGCRVVLLPRDDSRNGLRDFPTALAQTVRAGFPRDEALRAASANAAEALGLASDVGAIEKGRRADLVLWSGDPLGPAPRIEGVWIDGRRVEETP
jgi:imidazolonepropionase-like amidohydrolase